MEDKILIFSATYNEAKNIKYFLDLIEDLNLAADVLIIDDNSPDETWKIVQDYSKNKKNIKLIIRKEEKGLDSAHKLAFEYSISNDYKFLITLDADLSHDPKVIPDFIKELQTNTFVIGSRYIPGGKCDMTGFRLLLSYVGNKFIKFVINTNCSEFTSSFRGFKLSELKDLNVKDISSKGYSFFMETVYMIHQRGIQIKQIPIYFNARKMGKSKIPKIELFRTLFNLFRLKFKYK